MHQNPSASADSDGNSCPLLLQPEYRDYVWGGQRLRPGQLTAEAWVVFENSRVTNGPRAGRTLAEIAAREPAWLLGERAVATAGARFPLLIKILDSNAWMSLQVHPDDAWAARLEGPGYSGKTEAWYVLDAEPGARLVTGVRPGITADQLADAIRRGTILDCVQFQEARAGDTIFMPARTIHALGPGLLIWEVQQMSDLTYRIFDWGRPPTPDRPLHIDKSLAVVDPTASATVRPAPILADGQRATLVACPYFALELIACSSRPVTLDTAGQTFHALTVIEGTAEIVPLTTKAGRQSRNSLSLGRFESAVMPAACGAYRLRPKGDCKVIKASVA